MRILGAVIKALVRSRASSWLLVLGSGAVIVSLFVAEGGRQARREVLWLRPWAHLNLSRLG